MEKTKDRLLALIMKEASKNKLAGSGLFKGSMGVCLALFVLNREKKDQLIDDFASNLLDGIYARAIKERNAFFDTGFSGIGWGVNYLMENNYCIGDVDEVLIDIDAFVFKEITSQDNIPINVSKGLLGYLLYSIARLGNPEHEHGSVLHEINKDLFRELIVRIDRNALSALASICKDEYFALLWHVPLLLVSFRKALDLGIFNDKIINMCRTLLFYLETNQPYLHINKLYLAVSLAYLNAYLHFPEIEKQIEVLLYSIDIPTLKEELDPRIMNINQGWFGVVLILKKAEDLLNESVPNYKQIREVRFEILKEYWCFFDDYVNDINTQNSVDITFIHGISGMGFLLSLFPDAFLLS